MDPSHENYIMVHFALKLLIIKGDNKVIVCALVVLFLFYIFVNLFPSYFTFHQGTHLFPLSSIRSLYQKHDVNGKRLVSSQFLHFFRSTHP